MIPSAYRARLAVALTNGGSETSVFVNSLETLTGESVSFGDFSPFTRGIITVDPEATNSDQPEFISFTGIDTSDVEFTGATRGLSALGNSVVADNKVFHPVNTPVIIAWGGHNIQDLMDYITAALATASFGTANVVVATAGENLTAGGLVYLKNDGKWWNCDADTLATVHGVELGICQATTLANATISGGVLIKGLDTHQSGLVAGTEYYASNTAGQISSSVGTNTRVIGVARSTTTLYFDADYKQALAVQNQSYVYATDSVGTDAYAITLSPGIGSYATGQRFSFKAGTANTGAATLAVSGLAAKTIKKNVSDDLTTGDILANQICEVVYDGTNFQMVSRFPTSVPTVHRFYSIGNSTTQFDITNPGGTTYRYTYDGNGPDPYISTTTLRSGMSIYINAQNFAAGNKGVFTITGVGANYFEVTNASGSVESDKTIGTGVIQIGGQTYTPTPGTRYAKLQLVGAGGGSNGRGGGGAGEYVEGFLPISTLGASQTISALKGGIGNNGGGNATVGSIVTANGGNATNSDSGGGNTTSNGVGNYVDSNGFSHQIGMNGQEGDTSATVTGSGGPSFFGGGWGAGALGNNASNPGGSAAVIITDYP